MLGEALESCVVDDYMTADGTVAPLASWLVVFMYRAAGRLYLRGALAEAAKMLQDVVSIFLPLVSTASKIGPETSKALVDSWRKRGFMSSEASYALGLAALAARDEVNGETADLLLRVASAAVQQVTIQTAMLSVLAALRPLGEKAPHRYVGVLAAASELTTLDQETVLYIYNALQQLKNHVLETGCIWPLVEATRAYSNLLRKHLVHIKDRWEEAVVDMCLLYGEVKKRGAAAALNNNSTAQRLLHVVARAYVLATALENDGLASLVKGRCGLGDIMKEAEAVRGTLDEAAAHPEELRKIK